MASLTRRRADHDRRRSEVRQRLLDAVEQVAGQSGSYTEVTVERLAAQADISRATFYAYFPDKGELLRARFAQSVEELQAASESWWQLGPNVTRPALREAMHRIAAAYRRHTVVMNAVNDEATYNDLVRDDATAMMRTGIDNLQAHIERGQTGGWIDPQLPPFETAAWLMWMGERGHHQLVRFADEAGVESHVDTYTDIAYKTLYRF